MDKTAANHYNCPIVATYPEVIDKNMADLFYENNVEFYHPFLPYDNDDRMVCSSLILDNLKVNTWIKLLQTIIIVQ